MEAATFPQPAGELMIRPVSAAATFSTQTSSHLTTASQQASDVTGEQHQQRRTSSSLSREYHSYQQQQQQLQVYQQAPDRPSSAQRINRQQQLQIVTDLKRGTPGEPNAAVPRMAQRSPDGALVAARHKGQVYSEMFAYREPAGNVRERIARDSIITAEVKTNVIIHDEYSFLTSFSSFLSERYGRPESSVAITLQHSTCVLLGGSFDPAYVLTLTALAEQVSPTLNKRNAALVQRHLADELAVPPDRGVVRFVPIADSCLATAGTTMQAAVEAEKASSHHRNNTTTTNGAAADAQPRHSTKAGAPANGNTNNSSPWRAVWKHQSPTDSRASAGSGTTAVGSGTGSGGLFGRRKENRREVNEQERRNLLKGKSREVENRMPDPKPNGYGHDDRNYSRPRSMGGNGIAPESFPEHEADRRPRSSLARSFHSRRGSGKSTVNPADFRSQDGNSRTDAHESGDESRIIAQMKALVPKNEPRSSADDQAEKNQQVNRRRRSFMQLFGSR